MLDSFFTGVCKGCGSTTAAMVDDEKTTGTEIYEFVGNVLKSGRNLGRIEVERGTLTMQRCKCASAGKSSSQTESQK